MNITLLKIFLTSLVSIVSITFFAHAGTQDGELSHSLTETTNRAKVQIDEFKKGPNQIGDALIEKYKKLDQSIKDIVLAIFQDTDSFEDVKSKTPKYISWTEAPLFYNTKEPMTIEKRDKGRFDFRLSDEEWRSEENSVYIFYRHFQVNKETHLYYLQNSIWNLERQYGYRIFPSIYTVVVTNDSIQLFSLPQPGEDPTYFNYLSGKDAPVLLGFIEQGNKLPIIATISGPGGRMYVMTVILHTFQEEEKVWSAKRLLEVATFGEVSYDSEKYTLSFAIRLPNPEDNKTTDIPKEVTINLLDYRDGKVEKLPSFL